jgi:hypothetical protein
LYPRQTIFTVDGWRIEEADNCVSVASSVNFWLPKTIINVLATSVTSRRLLNCLLQLIKGRTLL